MELQQLVSNGNKWYKAAFCSLVLFFQGCGGSSGNGNVDRDQPIIIPSSPNQSQQTELTFKDGTVASGLSRTWAIQAALATDSEYMASGLAAVDYELDGDIDVYVSGGNSQPNKLFDCLFDKQTNCLLVKQTVCSFDQPSMGPWLIY